MVKLKKLETIGTYSYFPPFPACHYDSKSKIDGFVGAVDSAVPCSMMLYLAEEMTEVWKKRAEDSGGGLTVSMVFFDGEEALG